MPSSQPSSTKNSGRNPDIAEIFRQASDFDSDLLTFKAELSQNFTQQTRPKPFSGKLMQPLMKEFEHGMNEMENDWRVSKL